MLAISTRGNVLVFLDLFGTKKYENYLRELFNNNRRFER